MHISAINQSFPSPSAAAVTGSRGSPFSKVTTTIAYKTATSEVIDMNNTLVFRNLSTPPPLSSGYPSHFITEQGEHISSREMLITKMHVFNVLVLDI